MTAQESKTVDTKKEHGELMVAVATSIFIGIFSIFLDPNALKVFQISDILTIVGYIILWGVMGIVAICLMNDGLKRIGRARTSECKAFLCVPDTNSLDTTAQDSAINIQINHGNTHISISLQREQGENK